MKNPKVLLHRLLLLGAGTLLMALPASATTNLIHRYSFNDAGPTVVDSIRGSNGVARLLTTTAGVAPTFDGTKVTLDGTGGYIDLPNGLVSGLTNVSFEFWVTWTAGGTWTRLLDFGIANIGEDTNGTVAVGTPASNYVFIAATAGATPRFAITPISNGNENQINSSTNLPQNEEHYIVFTYGPARTPSIFMDGNAVGSGNYGTPLSVVRDVNCWLGRSLWPDPFFGGSFDEFRMHNTMLGQLEVLAANAAGPNTVNYTPENPTAITLNVISNMTSGTRQDATVTGVFPTYGTVIVGGSEVTLVSGSPSIVSVGAGNTMTALNSGTAHITATLGGQTSGADIVVTEATAFTALRHRYSFNESAGSTTANDSIGGAPYAATVVAPITTNPPVVISNGVANFPTAGNTVAGYINLPSGMVQNEFTNLTCEFWFTWRANNAMTWQRVFDFGNSLKGTDPRAQANGLDYITFTPQRGGNGARIETRVTGDGGATFQSVFNDGPGTPFPTNQEMHVVCTVAPGIGYSALYINGAVQNISATPRIGGTNVQLNAINTINMWLGMSQWSDPPFHGEINEFRMYEGLLSSLQIALDRQAGPNALPVSDPGTLTNVTVTAPSLYISNTATTQAILIGNFVNVQGVDLTPVSGASLTSTDTNIFTISGAGAMRPVGLGTASLIGSYGGLSATTSVSVLAPVSVSVTNLPVTLDLGNPATATYTVPLLANFPGPINNVDVSGFGGVTRTSSVPAVATVSAAGVVTVVGVGTTTISSTYNGLTAVGTVTVDAPSSVYFTNLPATVESGQVNYVVPLIADYPSGHTGVNISAAAGVVRTSSDANVATTTGGGTVTVRNIGTATITATYQGKTTSGLLTVVMPAGFVRGNLLNRYSFSEAVDTTTVLDSVSGSNGSVVQIQFGLTNGNFTGLGQYRFGPGPFQDPPTTNSYISLPERLISTHSSITIEGWFTWSGGTDNQRVFDFGMSSGAPDGSGGFLPGVVLNPGRNYFFLSPQQGRPRFAFDPDQGNFGIAETPSIQSPTAISITTGASSHFAIVYDFPRGVARLYVNGLRAGTGAAVYPLSSVDDRNNWLGRSNWQDPYFNGSIDEFRIYDGPFLDSDIADHYSVGPNVVIPYKPSLSIHLSGSTLTFSWPTNVGSGYSLNSSPVVGAGAVWNPAGSPTVVGQNHQVTVPIVGDRAFFRLQQ